MYITFNHYYDTKKRLHEQYKELDAQIHEYDDNIIQASNRVYALENTPNTVSYEMAVDMLEYWNMRKRETIERYESVSRALSALETLCEELTMLEEPYFT